MVNHPNRNRQPKWQPIETHPGDMNNVIVWNGYRVFLGWFSDEDGWRDATNQDRQDDPEVPQPTHWMPLPSPPTITG